jgi:hypothetical protein
VTTGQNFSLALGGQLSSDATRTEIIDFTYGVKQLLAEKLNCESGGGLLIDSGLKIRDFIMSKAFIASVPGSVGPDQSAASKHKGTAPNKSGPGPFGTFSDEIVFVVVYGGDITPTWKFVTVYGSTPSPFLNGSQSSTNDITISLGPATIKKDGTVELNPQTQSIHASFLTGQATSTAIQSQQH